MSTNTLSAVIIDDEEDGQNIIRLLLEQMFPSVEIAGTADCVEQGRALIAAGQPDIIFLDMELPDGNGFEALDVLGDRNPQVIVITAYDHYAIKAIKASVLDFVLKPINREEFRIAVEKAIEKSREATPAADLAGLLESFQKKMHIRRIKVPTLQGFILVDVDTIVRCEASDNYTILYFADRTSRTVSRTLSEYETELKDYGFVRIHHKHLINIKQVAEYQKGKSGGGYVIMNDKACLEVSVRKRNSWLKILDADNLSF